VLTDPVWGERTSPLTWLGPRRWYAPPVALADLPVPDAVLISHDHYDHLDEPTITALRGWATTFVVPLGVGAHLEYWGVPGARIVELDWWEEHRVGDLRLVATPARHASGRAVYDGNETLWAGYALVGPAHRVYFSGDTGLFPAMAEIGARLGPFDVTLVESGAYDPAWPDWHLGPEQAVRAHTMVRGELLVPIHWGLFDLAYHGWTEPVERVVVEAVRRRVRVAVPRPGQSIEADASLERWWPAVPWRTAAERPVIATQVPPEPAI
jgi:L-ascorbate metabolism protein UlaG (beta-lactamase superfamily)